MQNDADINLKIEYIFDFKILFQNSRCSGTMEDGWMSIGLTRVHPPAKRENQPSIEIQASAHWGKVEGKEVLSI